MASNLIPTARYHYLIEILNVGFRIRIYRDHVKLASYQYATAEQCLNMFNSFKATAIAKFGAR